ncbi:MAG: hypothetical protein CMO55_10580 [Verrucomicrobiales bacterium]|nr:hypothetical protein [Verrucomicrobiales bacterium]
MALYYTPAFRVSDRLLVLDRRSSPAKNQVAKKRRRRQGTISSRQMVWTNADHWNYVDLEKDQYVRDQLKSVRDRSIVSAWDRIGSAEEWSPYLLADIILILLETPFVESTYLLKLPDFGLSTIDIRPWLCDRSAIRELLVRYSSDWDQAIQILNQKELAEHYRYDFLKAHRPSQDRCPDLHALFRFGYKGDVLDLKWSEVEVRSALPFLWGGSLEAVKDVLALLEETGKSDPEKFAFLQRFVCSTNSNKAADWISLARNLSNWEQIHHFLGWVQNKTFELTNPRHLPCKLIRSLGERAIRNGRNDLHLSQVHDILKYELEPELLFDALALADAVKLSCAEVHFSKKATSRPRLDSYLELPAALDQKPDEDTNSWNSVAKTVMRTWERSLSSKVLRRHIEKKEWPDLNPTGLQMWFHILIELKSRSLSEPALQRWIDRLEKTVIETTPSDRSMLLECIEYSIDYLEAAPNCIQYSSLSNVASIIAKGFKELPLSACAFIGKFLETEEKNQQWGLGTLSRSAIKNIEQKFRNDVACERVENTLELLLQSYPDLDLGLYFLRPKQFLDFLDLAGTLPKDNVRSVAALFQHHPAFDFDPRRVEFSHVADLIRFCGKEWTVDLFHEKLKLHINGTRLLRDDKLEHYRNDFVGRVIDLRFALAKQHVDDILRSLARENLDTHTVQLLTHLERKNRRGMKRFAHALTAGNRNYRENHPANRDWIERNRHLDLSLWLYDEDHFFRVTMEGHDDLFIELETNPQEELKMGTLVGSCLSSGAFNSFSAVSNTLDVNKRVAFLRDNRGNFLARQLLAISREDKLVVFRVYSAQNLSSSDVYEEAFRSFDHFVAGKLGIEISNDGHYTIESLVVPHWYDDDSWAPESVPSKRVAKEAQIEMIPKPTCCPGLPS